jgi:CheY-like chemotaxis protein
LETINSVDYPLIVVVEDDEDDVYILKEGFDELGYKSVRFYPNALSIITYLNSIDDEYLPALLVTDFNLPAVNGFQLVQFLKNHSRLSSIPIVVLTTSMSVTNKKLFSAEGVAQVIIKPSAYDEYKLIARELRDLAEDA